MNVLDGLPVVVEDVDPDHRLQQGSHLHPPHGYVRGGGGPKEAKFINLNFKYRGPMSEIVTPLHQLKTIVGGNMLN